MSKAKGGILDMLNGVWEDGTRPKDLYATRIKTAPATYLADILSGLRGENRKVQGGCAELASLLSEDHPDLLYPHVDLFRENLAAKEPILRWEAVCTLGNLARVDERKVTRDSVEEIADLLRDKSIVLQGHGARALSKVAQAFPERGAVVLKALVDAADAFPGNRVGYVVEAMSAFAGDAALAMKAREFVKPYADSEIKAVASKAKKALKALASGAPR